MASSSIAGWQKERDAKQKQKQWDAQQNDHQDWQQKRQNMLQKKEEAEQKAIEAEQNAPEFLKKLGTMKEKSQQKAFQKTDEGPTIEELDDGTDIPPWHREGAPEKPKWVELLLLAAAKEAEEEEDHEHVFVASGSSNNHLRLDNLPSEEKQVSNEPEWMKQAKNLKSTPTLLVEKTTIQKRRNSLNSDQKKQPWQVPSKRSPQTPQSTQPRTNTSIPPKTSRSKSASDALVPGEEKPSWMNSAEELRKKKKPQPKQDTATTEDQPEWMAKRSKIKHKAETHEDEKAAESKKKLAQSVSADSQPEWIARRSKIKHKNETVGEKATDSSESKKPANESKSMEEQPAWMAQRSKIKQKIQEDTEEDSTAAESKQEKKQLHSTEGQPAWMAQLSKIKDKAKEEPSTKPPVEKNLVEDNGAKPAWMKHKLKPRVSVKELKSSCVSEKLENRPQLRKSPFIVSKADLMSNKVKEKLAQRPSLLDKKAPVKLEDMEWMKKKLKPRGGTRSDVKAAAADIAKEKGEDDGKPAWMKHKLKPRVSPEELKASKVQEKLDKKDPIRQSSIRLTKEELTFNKVKEKLAQRPSLVDKKSPIKTEEVEWMKKKLKPSRSSRNLIQDPPIADATDKRPEWMREAHRRMSSRKLLVTEPFSSDEDEEKKSRTSTNDPAKAKKDRPTPGRGRSKSNLVQQEEPKNADKRPDWMKKAQRMSARRLQGNVDDATIDIDASASSAGAPPPPAKVLTKQGSRRKVQTVGDAARNEGAVKNQSSTQVNKTGGESDVSGRTDKNKDTIASRPPPPQPEISPFDLFPIKPLMDDASLGSSFSSVRSREYAGTNKEELGFWSSMVEMGGSADEASTSSDSEDEKSDPEIDFTASMNDIGAVMSKQPALQRSKKSTPSLVMTTTERRKSRLVESKKSRSRSSSLGRKKKKSKDKDREKKKKKKRDKKEGDDKRKKEKKREKKKEKTSD